MEEAVSNPVSSTPNTWPHRYGTLWHTPFGRLHLSHVKILPAEAPPDPGTPCIFSPLHFFTFAGINQASLLYSIETTV